MQIKLGLIILLVLIVGGGVLLLQGRKTTVQNSSSDDTLNIPDTSVTKDLEEEPMQESNTQQPELPAMQIDATKNYQAVLKTTEGDITISLNPTTTPITVNNFVSLARDNFYNNTIFHRVIKGFMIQGGDPKGDGTGGPGYRFADEPIEAEYTRGTVAMANAGPNTNGSQFFIMHQDYPLPKNYVIFGMVTGGIEVVDKIAEAETKANPMSGESSTPVTPVTVTSVEIVEE